jgi:hypothetical protein
MATRAERFKSTTARHAQQDAEVSPPRSGNGKSQGRKSESQRTPSRAKRLAQAAPPDERRYGGPSTAARNRSLGKKAIHALEDSKAPAKPSRKSTRRGGKNRVKAATPLTSRQKLKVTSPTQQHDRGR